MTQHVSIRYSFPDPQLFELIAAYGEITVNSDDYIEDLVPPDLALISLTLSGDWRYGFDNGAGQAPAARAVLHGPTSRAKYFAGRNGSAIGIALHPLAWSTWFGCNASDFADSSAPLANVHAMSELSLLNQVMAEASFEERVAALNNYFLSLPKRPVASSLSGAIMQIRMALADPDCASVDELSGRIGMSQPRLSRVTMAHFGFTPKLLIQRERFRRMLHRADAHSYGSWRDFIEGQYVDQSHLIRDFKRFLGLSPSAYFELDRQFVAAAFAEARRLMGITPLEVDLKLAAE